MSELQAGMLLVATPALTDPNFERTVILLLDVTEGGALGVVLNRPTGLAVGQVLGRWGDVVAEPEVLFQGGPVETDGALAVAVRRGDEHVVGFQQIEGRLCLLDLETPLELAVPEIAGLRIFAGYAGWGAGQLPAEIEEGSWFVVPGLPPDVFAADTSGMWREVLRRQPGDLAWNSTRPSDPELN